MHQLSYLLYVSCNLFFPFFSLSLWSLHHYSMSCLIHLWGHPSALTTAAWNGNIQDIVLYGQLILIVTTLWYTYPFSKSSGVWSSWTCPTISLRMCRTSSGWATWHSWTSHTTACDVWTPCTPNWAMWLLCPWLATWLRLYRVRVCGCIHMLLCAFMKGCANPCVYAILFIWKRCLFTFTWANQLDKLTTDSPAHFSCLMMHA